MQQEFPFLIGRIALTQNWSVRLPVACKQRMEDGSMVLWRPGFTMWVTCWNNDAGTPAAVRKAQFKEIASPEGFDEREMEAAGRLYYSYRLVEESEDERVSAVYGFAIADDGHMQLAFYFDEEPDVELAYEVLLSANGDPADVTDNRIYSQLCFATNMIMEDGQQVNYMYRERPDSPRDSGWRFFSGYESQEYVDDLANTQVYPVAFVVERTPDIIPHLAAPTGSQFERTGEHFVPVSEG